MPEVETTIQIGDGPKVPLSDFHAAVDHITGKAGTVAADQLRLFIERIERLEEEKKGISDDIRDVYAEAKANGYDGKIMRQIVRLRALETHTRQEQDALLDTYRAALGLA
jgi:uncharacterized protein (UPF0335 family)